MTTTDHLRRVARTFGPSIAGAALIAVLGRFIGQPLVAGAGMLALIYLTIFAVFEVAFGCQLCQRLPRDQPFERHTGWRLCPRCAGHWYTGCLEGKADR